MKVDGQPKRWELTACVEHRWAEQIPSVFNMTHFARAWKALNVRPERDDPHPEKTDEKYCLYDERHRGYAYTPAYVKKLVKECRTEAGFRKLLSFDPKTKPASQSDGHS